MALFGRLNEAAGRTNARASSIRGSPRRPLQGEFDGLATLRRSGASATTSRTSRSRTLRVPKFSRSRRRTLRVDLLDAMFLDFKRLHSEIDLGQSAGCASLAREHPDGGQRARERPGACARGGSYSDACWSVSMRGEFQASWPGLARRETGVLPDALCPGYPREQCPIGISI